MSLRKLGILLLALLGTAPSAIAFPSLYGSIEGLIRDPSGAPFEFGLAVLVDENGNETNWVRTDAHGRYKMDDLLPGKYRVRLQPDFFRWTGDRLLHVWFKDSFTLKNATAVEVKPGSTTSEIDGRLGVPATVRGTVRSSGQPVPGVEILAMNEDQSSGYARTDEAGMFTLYLDSGSYRLVASTPEDMPEPNPRYFGRTWYGGLTPTIFTLSRGESISDIDFDVIDVPAPLAEARAAAMTSTLPFGSSSLADTGLHQSRTTRSRESNDVGGGSLLRFGPGRAIGTADFAEVNLLPLNNSRYGMLHASAVADCVAGSSGSATIGSVNGHPGTADLPPNTRVDAGRFELIFNYQQALSNGIEVAAIRVLDRSTGRFANYAYARASVYNCP